MKTEYEERLRTLDRIESPDLWTDAVTREPRPLPDEPSRMRAVIVAAVCVVFVAATLALVARAFDRRGSAGPRLRANRPVVLPANGEIWTLGGGGEGGSAIYSLDPLTGEKTLLWHDGGTPLPKDKANFALVATNYDYAWSPDGSRVAFSHVIPRSPGLLGIWVPFEEIYVMNADGSGLTQLTHDNAYDAFPSWSPD